MKNEKLTEEQIKVELRKLEQKEGLKDLDADVVSKTEEWHTFMLKAKAGKSKKQTKIQRKPTKATNEEEVSEADRQLHQKIAAEVKAKLEAKGKSAEGVETFEAFYGMIKEEAVKLQKEYQPQLRDGIKIAVDLVNSVKQDEKDGDVDIEVKIAPNTIDLPFYVNWNVDSKTVLTTHEETQVRALTGGNDVIALLKNMQVKKQDAIYISTIKEIRVMLALPKTAIFVGGHIAESNNSIFFENSLNPTTYIPKLGEIDIFADNTAIEVKSANWATKEKYNDKSLKQFQRYRGMKNGNLSIYLKNKQLKIEKTILQVESSEIHAKLLKLLIQENFFDEVRLGNGIIIKRSTLIFKKKKSVKKWAASRGNNFLITSEADFTSIP